MLPEGSISVVLESEDSEDECEGDVGVLFEDDGSGVNPKVIGCAAGTNGEGATP